MDEQLDLTQKDKQLADYWKGQIEAERKAHQAWIDAGEEAERQYKKDQNFNIFWSNVSVLQGALFSNTPSAEVRKRHKDSKGPQRDAAAIVERALDFMVDTTDFDNHVSRAVLDYLTAGLGQVRVRYKPEFATQEVTDPLTGELMTQEVIESQSCEIEFFSWKDFGWQPCKAWSKCEWVYVNHYMTKKEVMERYDVKAEEDTEVDDDNQGNKKVKVTEIYHKPARSVIVICDQFDHALEIRDEGLGLNNVFPCPRPLMANVSSKVMIPTPDLEYYKKQAKNLDETVRRIDSMAKSVKDVGFYDAHFTELQNLQRKADGALVPVENLMEKLSGNTLDNVIAKKPIKETVETIISMQQYAEQKKAEIYEITGISDIVRGETKASETATAQDIKTQFATIRLRDKQASVALFVRDIFRIMAEIIGEHFEPQVLQKMTGVEVTEEVMGILRDDVMRNFSIDVETESTIARDEHKERQQRMEALQAITSYMQNLIPAMSQGALPMEVGKELLALSIRGFKYTGNLEDMIQQMGTDEDPATQIQKLTQALKQLQQHNQQMKQELGKVDQADSMNKMADTKKKLAEADRVAAETQEQNIENAWNMNQAMMGGYPVAIG